MSTLLRYISPETLAIGVFVALIAFAIIAVSNPV